MCSRPGFPAPYDALYHTTDDIEAEFAALAARHPELMTWAPGAESTNDATLGVATFGMRGAGGAADTAARPQVLLVFGEHAREIITSDTALWLARALTGAHPPAGVRALFVAWLSGARSPQVRR